MAALDTVPEAPNPIHSRSGPRSSWSTLNVSEALPGVATPLCWGLWSEVENSPRAGFHAMGALDKSGLMLPTRPEDRIVNLFYGRLALRVDFLCEMADLVPGTTGESLAQDIFGYVPPDFVPNPSKRRWPYVAVKLPREFRRTPKASARVRADTDRWWRDAIARVDGLSLDQARALYVDAADHFRGAISASSTAVTCAIQPVFQEVAKLAAATGLDPSSLMKGHGRHEESVMVADLWEVSRDRLALEAFLERHGYHGPDEGELSAHVWREDPTPLRAIIDGYRALGEDGSPKRRMAAAVREREEAEAYALRVTPRSKRAGARLVLRLARTYLPLRAVTKVAFVQSIDVGRAAARRGGRLLAEQGVLADPEDVFMLTREEFLGALPADLQTVIEDRKAVRERYQRLELPTFWTGQPVAHPIETKLDGDELEGIGVSPGVVEGLVRVVADPADTEMEQGEILVTHTTDPSWASVMFLAGALVVDIGGQFSHAAVVARELGVPCVLNTKVGSHVLESGDRVRVDGTVGTVAILERAAAPPD